MNQTLTGIRDVDLKILQELTDKELSVVCSVNKKVADLCNDESFWMNRLYIKLSVIERERLGNLIRNKILPYKQLYRDVFMDAIKGMKDAIDLNHVSLFNICFKRLGNNNEELLWNLIPTMVKKKAFNILSRVLFSYINSEDNVINIVDIILKEGDEITFIWLNEMQLTGYFDYIYILINYMESDDFNRVLNQIQKYLPYISDSQLELLLELLGQILSDKNIEKIKKLYTIIYPIATNKNINIVQRIKRGLDDEDVLASDAIKEKFLNYIIKFK